MQCKGFLFDLDGTLVDSLPVVERSWCKWGDRFAIDHDEILSFIHGKQAITSIRHFMPGRSEEDIQAEFRYLEQIEATDIEGIVAQKRKKPAPHPLHGVYKADKHRLLLLRPHPSATDIFRVSPKVQKTQ